MDRRLKRNVLIVSVCSAALVLGGCVGGGGGTGARPDPTLSAPPPAPPPPPPPAPPPPPPPPPPALSVRYNDSEYQRSNGAVSSGAIHAWDAGGTGRGVKVGVIDSGINPSLPEFAG